MAVSVRAPLSHFFNYLNFILIYFLDQLFCYLIYFLDQLFVYFLKVTFIISDYFEFR